MSEQYWQLSSSTPEYLRGRWQVERRLTDYRSGKGGWFTGWASFAPASVQSGWPPELDWPCALEWWRAPNSPRAQDGPPVPDRPGATDLAYCERGELRFGDHRGPAGRSLIYRPAPGGAAEVLFADGRPFYLLDLRSGCWQAEHPCGSDHYLLTVGVTSANSFTEHWRTRGPGKNYEMTTTLSRIGTRA